MEAKRKKRSKRSKKQEAKKDSRIPFEVFFAKKVREGALGFWQEKEILTFFTEKGLSKLEDQDKYEEILQLY